MKSSASASPNRSALADRSCGRFSPASVMPASTSAPGSSTGTYLTAAKSSTSAGVPPGARRRRRDLLAHALRGWRAPGRGRGRGSAPPRHPRLAARDAAVAPVGEEQRGSRADRAQPGIVDLRDAGFSQPRAAIALRSSVAPSRPGPRARTPRAPPRRPRSSTRRHRARSRRAIGASRRARAARDPVLDDAVGQPAPARVQHRDRSGRRPARPAGSRL